MCEPIEIIPILPRLLYYLFQCQSCLQGVQDIHCQSQEVTSKICKSCTNDTGWRCLLIIIFVRFSRKTFWILEKKDHEQHETNFSSKFLNTAWIKPEYTELQELSNWNSTMNYISDPQTMKQWAIYCLGSSTSTSPLHFCLKCSLKGIDHISGL